MFFQKRTPFWALDNMYVVSREYINNTCAVLTFCGKRVRTTNDASRRQPSSSGTATTAARANHHRTAACATMLIACRALARRLCCGTRWLSACRTTSPHAVRARSARSRSSAPAAAVCYAGVRRQAPPRSVPDDAENGRRGHISRVKTRSRFSEGGVSLYTVSKCFEEYIVFVLQIRLRKRPPPFGRLCVRSPRPPLEIA